MSQDRNDGLAEGLSKYFGYSSFRPGQEEIIRHIVDGRDVLALMPTGAGKSLCFQLPAVLLERRTIVVSPLLALMDDQTAALGEAGISADAIHSGRRREDNVAAWRRFVAGESRLLYLSPERLMTERMIAALKGLTISTIVVDEAHCISKWGAGFRPDYEALSTLKEHFPETGIAAFTATADRATRQDIVAKLSRGECEVILRGFDRPNLSLAVAEKSKSKQSALAFLHERAGQSGIVYCLSRNETEEIAEYFSSNGILAIAYHAGIDSGRRTELQNRFMSEEGVVMVATIAFGMGIDKPDIRFVLHLSLPASVEAFYQEIGRAGRDGQPAETILYYGLSDLIRRQRMIFEDDTPDEFKIGEYNRLEALLGYCETIGCRRRALLGYFDEQAEDCGNCDNCLSPPQVEDCTELARGLLAAVHQTGQFFGAGHIVDVAKGAQTAKVLEKRHDKLSSYGKLSDKSKPFLQALLRQLIASSFLKVNFARFGAIQMSKSGWELIDGQARLMARVNISPVAAPLPKKRAAPSLAPDLPEDSDGLSDGLLKRLKELRLEIAREKKVPAYVVFPDRTLVEMSRRRPATEEAFLAVNGVGEAKREQYFEPFSKAIASYMASCEAPAQGDEAAT